MYALYEGVGTAENIDQVMKLGNESSHGAAGIGGPHRSGYLPCHLKGFAFWVGGSEVPPMPHPSEICGCRVVRRKVG